MPPSVNPPTPRRPSGVTLRRLLSLARPEVPTLVLATCFLVISSGASLAFPQGIRILIDDALNAKNRELIDRAALIMLGVFLVQGVATALRAYFFTIVGDRVVMRLRRDFFHRLMDQEVAFFDTHRTGELTSRLQSDTAVLQNTVSVNISMGLRHAVQTLGGVALLFYTSPTLTLLMLAIVPPVAVGSVLYGRRVRLMSRQVQDALAKASEVAEESLSGLRTVRSFAAEPSEVARYGNAVRHAFEVARRRASQSSIFIGGVSSVGYIAAVVVFWYGGRLVVDSQLTIGALTSFLIYTMLVAMSLGSLADLWADFMRASGAAERVFELMDREPTIPAGGGERPATVEGRVEFQDVRFAYPSRPDVTVLQGINLTLQAGEVVAVVGSSGAGKSTLAALLSRFYDPHQGRLLLDGRPLDTLDPAWLRQHVGMVAQEPLLFSCSIGDNIRYGRPGATDAEVEAAAKAAHAHDFIGRFPDGYRTEVGERGVQLSGGQKQRVAIARAVLKDPRILVLDEATSALDAESEHLVKDALERLMQGRTTLIIAHRLSTVANAHRVLVLESGRVVQSGTHAALMTQEGLYRRLVERQVVAA
ncbi:ABC transporter ATP-binding protein [Corallococcus sicarius]|uniref:ATP-binding cassette domain-containing protein n=1 Tax=Corallococcus sicarius TaxID=2316726 RepID=A0A3A8NMX7_9BACT|nr:ABC transporter transmembrane domain-containing protein [Corallococcus sicarius]RKH42525.1 ATP-binding cassette domain-containing protein [Corallococcus sicarius]